LSSTPSIAHVNAIFCLKTLKSETLWSPVFQGRDTQCVVVIILAQAQAVSRAGGMGYYVLYFSWGCEGKLAVYLEEGVCENLKIQMPVCL
jgi:hypothetical protein